MSRWYKCSLASILVLLLSTAAHANSGCGPYGCTGSPTGQSSGDGSTPFTSIAEAPGANLFEGVATSAIGIPLPPGRKNLTPKVSLQYSSSSSRSAYGYGWTVPRASISRSTKDGAPHCGADPLDDTFVMDLNGSVAEIVRVPGTNRFRGKIEGPKMLIAYDASASVNAWRVIDRDGTVYRFGGPAPGLRFGTSTCTTVWQVESAEDTLGNTIKYEYTPPSAADSGGSPLTITYGGNTAGIADQYSVHFVWSNVTYPAEPKVSYSQGYKELSSKRLTRIITRANLVNGSGQQEWQYIRDYTIGHSIDTETCTTPPCGSGTDTLTSIGLTAYSTSGTPADNVTMPPASFVYSPAVQPARNNNAGRSWSSAGWTARNNFWSSSKIPFITGIPTVNSQGRFRDRNGQKNEVSSSTFDINGDGILDYVDGFAATTHFRVRFGVVLPDGTPTLSSTWTNWNWPIPLKDKLSLDSVNRPVTQLVVSEPGANNMTNTDLMVSIFDLDGDSLPEVVDADVDRCRAECTQAGVTVPTEIAYPWCVYHTTFTSGVPSGFSNTPTVWAGPSNGSGLRGQSSDQFSSITGCDTLDFTGDGRPDVVCPSAPPTCFPTGPSCPDNADKWRLYENTGKGFAPFVMFVAPTGCHDSSSTAKCLLEYENLPTNHGNGGLYDINGDGLRDFVFVKTGYEGVTKDLDGQPHWTVFFGTGRGFQADPVQWKIEGSGYTLPNRISTRIDNGQATTSDLIDVTGDGLPDLVRRHTPDADPSGGTIPYLCEGSSGAIPSQGSTGSTYSESSCWNLLLYVNTGSSFAKPIAMPSPADAIRADYGQCAGGGGGAVTGGGCYDLMDPDGDGLIDLVAAIPGPSSPAPQTTKWGIIRNPASTHSVRSDLPNAIPPATQTKPNLLLAVMNGLGGQAHLEYAPATEVTAGTLPYPQWVVTQRDDVDTVTGARDTLSYGYRGGFYDGEDREARGFAAVRVMRSAWNDPATGIDESVTTPGSGTSTLTEFYQDDRRKGTVRREWKLGAVPSTCPFGGDPSSSMSDICSPMHYALSLNENCWEADSSQCCWLDSCPNGDPEYRYSDVDPPAPLLMREQRSTPYLAGEGAADPVAFDSLRKTIRLGYDSFGNTTSREVRMGTGSGSSVSTTTTSYHQPSSWDDSSGSGLPQKFLVSRPSDVTTTDASAGGAIVNKQVYTYFDDGRVKTSGICQRIAGSVCTPTVTTFGYDGYGNIISKTSPEQMTTYTDYDSVRHQYPVSMTDTAGLVSIVEHDPATGAVVFTQNPNGYQEAVDFDGLGRAVRFATDGFDVASTPRRTTTYVLPVLGGATMGSGSGCPHSSSMSATPGRVEIRENIGWTGTTPVPALPTSYTYYDAHARVLGVKSQTQVGTQTKTVVTKFQRRDQLGNATQSAPPFESNVALTTWTETCSATPAVTTFTYDVHGRLERQDLPNGSQLEFIPGQPGVSVSIDANLSEKGENASSPYEGAAVVEIFDGLGRRISKEVCSNLPDASAGFTRCGAGESIARTHYAYDALDRVVLVEQAIESNSPDSSSNRKKLTETFYDGNGDPYQVRDYDSGSESYDFGVTEYRYNRDGAISRVSKPDRTRTRYKYDRRTGQLLRATTTAGPGSAKSNIEYTYGAPFTGDGTEGRVKSVTITSKDAERFVTSVTKEFTYTSNGLVATESVLVDADVYGVSSLKTEYGYDSVGRLIQMTYPALTSSGARTSEIVETYWNEFGQPKELNLVDPATGLVSRQIVKNISYDINGNVVDLHHGNDVHDYATYETTGNRYLKCLRASTSTTNAGCLAATTSDRQALDLSSRDHAGRILQITDLVGTPSPVASSNYLKIEYDGIGRVTDADYAGGEQDDFEYDDLGNMKKWARNYSTSQLAAGTTTYSYGGRHPHRLMNLTTDHPTGPDTSRAVAHSDIGERTQKGTKEYVYDAGGRLTHVGQIGAAFYDEVNFYDEGGARVVRYDGTGVTHYLAGGMINLTESSIVRYYSIGGRAVARDEFTGTGDLWTESPAGTIGSAGGGKPNPTVMAKQAGQAAHTAAGIAGTAGLVLFVFAMAATLSMLVVAGDHRGRVAAATAGFLFWMTIPLPSVIASRFGGVLGVSVAEAAAAAAPTWHLHLDHIGSVQVVTDASKAAVQKVRYRVFGEQRWSSLSGSTPATERTFTSHVEDSSAQLIYMGARHYDPDIGTFLTVDPADQYASPYTYAGNNPVGVVDPTGAFGVGEALLLSAAIAFATSFVATLIDGGNLGDALTAGATAAAWSFVGAGQTAMTNTFWWTSEVRTLISTVRMANSIKGIIDSFKSGNTAAGIIGAASMVQGALGLTEQSTLDPVERELAVETKTNYNQPSDGSADAGALEGLAPANKLNSKENGLGSRGFVKNGVLYVIFTSTQNWTDWITNFRQAFRMRAEQYKLAQEIAKEASAVYGRENVVFVGHSLGGGLAAAAAYATNGRAITFNAAGLASRYAVGSPMEIRAHHNRLDPLTIAQRLIPVLPTAPGTAISQGGFRDGHEIANLMH